MHTTVKIGDLVFISTLHGGLVPGKVAGYVTAGGHAAGQVTVKVTAERRAYRRGELTPERPNDVVPRGHVYIRNGKYRVRGTWEFAGLPTEFQPRWATA